MSAAVLRIFLRFYFYCSIYIENFRCRSIFARRLDIDSSVQYFQSHLRSTFYFMTSAEQTSGRGWYKAFSLIPRRAIGI